MPTFYNYTEGGQVYALDDAFVSADAFRQGTLFTWGQSDAAQLGVNDTNNRCTPVTTFAGGANWKQVSGGNGFIAAIKTDGTLWTWGYNASANLGTNNGANRCTPVTTFAGGTNWKQVSCGSDYVAAIKTDGTLWTWGAGDYGKLGVNDTNRRSTPVTTFAGGTNWKQVDCGANHMAAIKTDGTLWNWGFNQYGQVGDNTLINSVPYGRLTPVTTFAGGTNWKQVSSGQYHTAAIKTDGTLWIWGGNYYGKLGNNNVSVSFTTSICTPITTFAGGTNWKQVDCGGDITVAIKTDGTLWNWGFNGNGYLGINVAAATGNRCTPVTTFAGGTNWKQVTTGFYFNTAVKTDGTLWGWGYNSVGNLGTNSTPSAIITPVTTFAGGTNWKQVYAGQAFTAAVTYIDDYQ